MAPTKQPFLEAVCHNVRPEKFHLMTDDQMRAHYAYGLENRGVWGVQPKGAELAYIKRLGLRPERAA